MEKFVAIDNAFLFMSSVENTTAYWKQFFYDVIAMSKQQGIPKYQERYSLLNNNPALVARYFQYKTGVFFKEIILEGSLGKTNIMLYVSNFKKMVAHIFVHSYGISTHQILKMKLPTLKLLRKQ